MRAACAACCLLHRFGVEEVRCLLPCPLPEPPLPRCFVTALRIPLYLCQTKLDIYNPNALDNGTFRLI